MIDLGRLLCIAGLTRRKLALEGVVSRDTLLRIERGQSVRRSSLTRLAARLGVRLDELRPLLARGEEPSP